MADQAASTPQSTSETNAAKASAAKDKNCPFCDQAFTSSSLGRHLDIYIKAKNPKAPDGIHNVDEILRLRGGITRRQTRTSSAKKESSTPRSVSKPSGSGPGSPHVLALQSPVQRGYDSKGFAYFNQAGWHSNGAANHLPSRQNGVSATDMRRENSRHHQLKADLDQRHKSSEDLENGKAAMLALKEVLSSLKDASARSNGAGLFDFDPYALNFPSLCLQILPSPPTLFSPTPFATSESWSIQAPGQKQLEALQRLVKERLLAYQRQRQQHYKYPAIANGSSSSSPLPTPPLLDVDPQRLLSHLADAYNHWRVLPDKQRQDAWQVEILRACTRLDEARREAENGLEAARREIEHLKANRWTNLGVAQPQCFTPIMGSQLHLPTSTAKIFAKTGLDITSWDFDRLIDKWKGVVKENKQSTNGMSAQRSLSNSSTPLNNLEKRQTSMLNSSLNHVNNINGNVSMPGSAVNSPTKSFASQMNGRGEQIPIGQTNSHNGTDDNDTDIDAEQAPEDLSQQMDQQQLQIQQQPQPPQRTPTWPQHNLTHQDIGQQRQQNQLHQQHHLSQQQHHHLNSSMHPQQLNSNLRRTTQPVNPRDMMNSAIIPMDGIPTANNALFGRRMQMNMGLMADDFSELSNGGRE